MNGGDLIAWLRELGGERRNAGRAAFEEAHRTGIDRLHANRLARDGELPEDLAYALERTEPPVLAEIAQGVRG